MKLPAGALGAVETGQSLADASFVSSSRSAQPLPGASAVTPALAVSALLPAPAARRPFTAPRARILAELPPSSGPAGPGLLPATALHRCSRAATRPSSAQPAQRFEKHLPSSAAAWESFGSSFEMIGSSFADIPFSASLLDHSGDASPTSNWPAFQASKPKSADPSRLDGCPRGRTRPESAPCVRRLLQKLSGGVGARPWMEHDAGPAARAARELVPGMTVQGWSYLGDSQEILASSSSFASCRQISHADPNQAEPGAHMRPVPVPSSSAEGVDNFGVRAAKAHVTTGDDAPEKHMASLTTELEAISEKAQPQSSSPDQPHTAHQEEATVLSRAGNDAGKDDATALQASITAALTRNWSGFKKGVLKTSASAGTLLPQRRISAPRKAGRGMPYVLKEPFPQAPSVNLTSNICGIEALLAGRRAAWSKSGLMDETHAQISLCEVP